MTYPTPEMVASGVPYAVRSVNDQPPSSIADFDGVVAVAVEGVIGGHLIRGVTAPSEDGVRLYEKGEDGVGKDVRIWQIRHDETGFTATAQ